jgi:hypothetical protein
VVAVEVPSLGLVVLGVLVAAALVRIIHLLVLVGLEPQTQAVVEVVLEVVVPVVLG